MEKPVPGARGGPGGECVEAVGGGNASAVAVVEHHVDVGGLARETRRHRDFDELPGIGAVIVIVELVHENILRGNTAARTRKERHAESERSPGRDRQAGRHS